MAAAASALTLALHSCNSSKSSQTSKPRAAKTSLRGFTTEEFYRFSATWKNFNKRFEKEEKDAKSASCMTEFMAPLQSYRDSSFESRTRAVDKYVNHFLTYAEDSAIYKKAEYWATPAEVIQKTKADCEDYANLKKVMLERLGVPDSLLHIAVVTDYKQWPDRALHATLFVGSNPRNILVADDYPDRDSSTVRPFTATNYTVFAVTEGSKLYTPRKIGMTYSYKKGLSW